MRQAVGAARRARSSTTTEARSGSMNTTPSAVATATRVTVSTRMPGQRPVGDRGVEPVLRVAAPRVAEDDRRARRRRGEPRLVVGRVGREDVGEGRGDRARVGHVVDGRRRAPTRCRRARGRRSRPGRASRRPSRRRGRRSSAGRPRRRPRTPPSSVTSRWSTGWSTRRERRSARAPVADPAVADRGQVERREPAVVVADDELVARLVDRPARWRPAAAMVEISCARPQVVGPDLGPGRDVQPLAGALVRARARRPGAARRRRRRTGTPRSLVALTSSWPHRTSPPAIAYLARCGWVHS